MFVIYSQLTHLLNCFADLHHLLLPSSSRLSHYSIVCLLAFAYFYNGDLLVFFCFLYSCFSFKLLDKFVSAATLHIYTDVFPSGVCGGGLFWVYLQSCMGELCLTGYVWVIGSGETDST